MSNTNTRLTRAEDYKLMKWVEARADAKTLTDNQLTQVACVELGMNITRSNITGVRGALGIGKRAPHSPSKPVDVLVSAVLGLYKELGIPAPADLTALKKE